MLAGLISTAARGIKGGAEAYGMAAKSEFDKNQKVDLSKQLSDMEEQMRLRVDDVIRSRNVADVGNMATATAAAAPIVAEGAVAGQVATENAISASGLAALRANNKVDGVNADLTAGLPTAQAALTAEQLKAGQANVTELARQKGGAVATEFNAKVGSPEYLKSLTSEAAAKETPAARSQRALAEFTLINAKVLADARASLAKATDPEERDALSRTISDLSGASTKNFGDVAAAARSWVTMAQSLRKDAELAMPEVADELLLRAQGYEESADALLTSIAEKRLPGSGKTFPIPPPAAIERLRDNPSLKSAFDAKYGKGASAKHLGGK